MIGKFFKQRGGADPNVVAGASFGGGGELYQRFLEQKNGDLHKWHHYFAVYERYFERFRHKPISMLEIGVFRGGSLRFWREYFGPEAKITGMDVNPDCAKFATDGTEVFIGDQADRGFLEEVARKRGPFDIVLDDGGHTSNQQLVSFEVLFPHTKDGGIYMVEDCHASLWPRFQDHPLGVSFLDVSSRMAEKLTWWHQGEASHERFGKPLASRSGEVAVPAITRQIFSIAFYDSIVVFEKMPIGEPHHEIR